MFHIYLCVNMYVLTNNIFIYLIFLLSLLFVFIYLFIYIYWFIYWLFNLFYWSLCCFCKLSKSRCRKCVIYLNCFIFILQQPKLVCIMVRCNYWDYQNFEVYDSKILGYYLKVVSTVLTLLWKFNSQLFIKFCVLFKTCCKILIRD